MVRLTLASFLSWHPLGPSTTYWLMVANHILLLGMGFGLGYGVCWFKSERWWKSTNKALDGLLSPDREKAQS